MNRTSVRASALACALLATSAITAPALAQSGSLPIARAVDANGVDLVNGGFVFSLTEGRIGSGPGAVSLERGESTSYTKSREG